MTSRDDSHGGRYEPMTRPGPSAGLAVTGRCDECQRDSARGRGRAKVRRGPLRGLAGMVCGACIARRAKVPA